LVTGRYRLVESIGQGGMGRVWRAADEMLDRQIAVKEMRIDGLDAEDTRTRRERTLREARATARIDHPNVVRVYDVVDEGERLWIVMELVAGRSLERMLADDGALGPREVARIGLGLVAALRQVHAGGVLHRDIKPGNVLVESGGRRVVLTDFGIAAIQDATALTMVGMLVGSPDYMAPERISGRPQGPPSDIWSLGATLCAALGGRSPFARDTTLATLHAVLYEEPELPSAAGPLREILAALLEKAPAARPGLDELERALAPVAFPREEREEREEREGSEGPEEQERQERPETEELAAPETQLGEESPPEVYRESPTPAFLAPPLVRAARDPRLYGPDPDPDPHPVEDAIPTQRPAVEELASAAEGASEAASELSSELGSEASANNSRSPAPRRTGVSLVRADQGERAAQAERGEEAQLAEGPEALTARKPVPLPAHPPAPRPAPPHPGLGPGPVAGSRSPRPAPPRLALGPHPARVPRPAAGPSPGGELPGPAQPFTPDRTHRTRRRIGLIAIAAVVVAGAVVGTILANSGGSSGTSSASATSTEPSASPSPTSPPRPRPPPRPPRSRAPPAPRPCPRARTGGGRVRVGDARRVAAGSEDGGRGALHVPGRHPGTGRQVVARARRPDGDLGGLGAERAEGAGLPEDPPRQDDVPRLSGGELGVHVHAQGRPWHARLLGFDEDGKSYQINTWYQPDVETQALKTYDKVKNSFVVL
jgi:serine/threonine protein kinase